MKKPQASLCLLKPWASVHLVYNPWAESRDSPVALTALCTPSTAKESGRAQVSWSDTEALQVYSNGPFDMKSCSLTKSQWPREWPFNLHYLVYIGNIYTGNLIKAALLVKTESDTYLKPPPSPPSVRCRLLHFSPNWQTGLHFPCVHLSLWMCAVPCTGLCTFIPHLYAWKWTRLGAAAKLSLRTVSLL